MWVVKPQKCVVKCSTKKTHDDADNSKTLFEHMKTCVSSIAMLLFLHIACVTMHPLSMCMFLRKTFFYRSVSISNWYLCRLMIRLTGNNTNRTTIKNVFCENTCVLNGCVDMQATRGKGNVAIDEACVFACSNEVFKFSASSCVFFVECLTTRFHGLTAHSQF